MRLVVGCKCVYAILCFGLLVHDWSCWTCWLVRFNERRMYAQGIGQMYLVNICISPLRLDFRGRGRVVSNARGTTLDEMVG